jgi:hypothetical protein
MSGINTNGINTKYPVPGVNNNTQGFRDNFTNIKNNLSTAAREITDLQSKVVVKSALTGSTVNNDMANTLISNALVRSFRATTYNLGNNITTSGETASLKINVSLADVQYGTITGDTVLDFGGWAPAGTQSNVQLILSVANANATLTFPDTIIGANGFPVQGMTTSARVLENYASNSSSTVPAASTSYTNKVTTPYGVNQLHYTISTTDCGSTIEIAPTNRNTKTNQITTRTPTATGQPGDTIGTICSDSAFLYICIGNYVDNSTTIWKKVALSNI